MNLVQWLALRKSQIDRLPEEHRGYVLAALSDAWTSGAAWGSAEPIPRDLEDVLNEVGDKCGDAVRDKIQVALLHYARICDSLSAHLVQSGVTRDEGVAAMDSIPKGGIPMGGDIWKCPRCNFINGRTNPEHECRHCGYPSDAKEEEPNE